MLPRLVGCEYADVKRLVQAGAMLAPGRLPAPVWTPLNEPLPLLV